MAIFRNPAIPSIQSSNETLHESFCMVEYQRALFLDEIKLSNLNIDM